jgi:hypothetical protein
MEKDHDLPDGFLVGPGGQHPRLAFGPTPGRESKRWGSCSMTSNTASPKACTNVRAKCGPIPGTIPEPRYFSIVKTEFLSLI